MKNKVFSKDMYVFVLHLVVREEGGGEGKEGFVRSGGELLHKYKIDNDTNVFY